jgi:hypothetical protein
MNARLRLIPLLADGSENRKGRRAKVPFPSDSPTGCRRFPFSRQTLKGLGKSEPATFRHRVMPWLLLICLLGGAVNAQFTPPDTASALSSSGQFVIHGTASSARTVVTPALTNNGNYLKLEPAFVAVYCERIKVALADTLGDRSQWRGKVHVILHAARSLNDDATIVAEKFMDGWQYRLEMPVTVKQTRFVQAVVGVLLLERANRNASDHSAEIPLWLSEGLTKQLLAQFDRELTPRPTRWGSNGRAMGPTVFEIRTVDPRQMRGRPLQETVAGNVALIERLGPLEAARLQLRERPPLTLQELTWPDNQVLALADGEVYRNNALLFVTELMRLNDGRACLSAMLDGLAQCYNWQTAFFRAFHAHFVRQLDLEKWWALQVVYFTGRDSGQTWSPEESWMKLDEILRTPVEVRRSPNSLPSRAEVSLATIIRDWDFVHQDQTLRAKLQQLELVRLRVAQDLVGLVDDYRHWLAEYLEKRDRAGILLPGSKIAAPGAKLVVRDALKQLDELESRRMALRPPPAPVSAAKTNVVTAASP